MALLGKAQILAADDIDYEDVSVPKWGGEVRVRGLSGIERDKYEKSLIRTNKSGQQEPNIDFATARLVAWCSVDENNSRLFHGEDEVKELAAKSASCLQRVFEVACKLSGLTPDDVEEMVEGFGETRSGSSTSD